MLFALLLILSARVKFFLPIENYAPLTRRLAMRYLYGKLVWVAEFEVFALAGARGQVLRVLYSGLSPSHLPPWKILQATVNSGIVYRCSTAAAPHTCAV